MAARVPPSDDPMDGSVTLYVTGEAGEGLDPSVAHLLEERGLRLRAVHPEAVPDALPEGGGWILVTSDAAPSLLGRVLLRLADSPDPWTVLILDVDEDGVRFVPCSPGYPETLEAGARRLQEDGLDAGFLGHRKVLAELSRIRHDTNNALTSALAETQFMRMDAPAQGELADGLGVVEGQLKRIRDLVGELAVLRPPRS